MIKSKTVLGAVAAILSAAGAYLAGELELGAALNIGVTSILAIFLRHGVKKTEDAAKGV
jgi:hypothetical protein|tara:strand:+ start:1368 stop:1544 length:177 start_codon:yes stop_codon:yes gene_type:complete